MGQVLSAHELGIAIERERAAGRIIVLTNGCFDLLHVGHVRSLHDARALGDVLVVGVNADQSVRALKGPGRPLVPAAERAEVLAALASVDYVATFPETTAVRLVEIVRPDIYAKGSDYAGSSGTADGFDPSRLPEARVVEAHGGRIVLLPLTQGRSTTDLVTQIMAEQLSASASASGKDSKEAGATAGADRTEAGAINSENTEVDTTGSRGTDGSAAQASA